MNKRAPVTTGIDPDAITQAIAVMAPVTSSSLVSITNDKELELAADELRWMKDKETKLETLRKSITKPLDDAKKAVMDLFRPATAELLNREHEIRTEAVAYRQRREAARLAEEARLRDDRLAIEAEAEAEARRLRKQGKPNEARLTLETLPSIPVVIAEADTSGLGSRKTWKAKVVDFDVLVLYALEHNQALIQIDEKVLGQMARSTQGKMNLPGVEFYSEEGVVVR